MAGKSRTVAVLLILYLIIAAIGCSPAAVATHEGLKLMSIDSEIAVGVVENKTSYTHIFVIVDGHPYEPRFGGAFLLDHIDYAHPRDRYGSTDQYLAAGYDLFPDAACLLCVAQEIIAEWHA